MKNLTALLFPFPSASQVPLDLFPRCFSLILRLHGLVPDPGPLTGAEEKVGGLLFEEGGEMVGRLTDAMIRQPGLFRGYPDPLPLLERQLRATGWHVLARILGELQERAARLYRLEQSAATREGLQILRRGRDAFRSRGATAEDRQRGLALFFAERALYAWQRRKLGRRFDKWAGMRR